MVACDWTNFDVPLLEEDRKASAFGVLLTNQRNGMPYIYIYVGYGPLPVTVESEG